MNLHHGKIPEGFKMNSTTENFKQVHLNDFDSSLNFESLPDSIMTSTRDVVFFAWQTLEEQLSLVDHGKYPEISQALDISAASVFDAWLTFRDIGKGEV